MNRRVQHHANKTKELKWLSKKRNRWRKSLYAINYEKDSNKIICNTKGDACKEAYIKCKFYDELNSNKNERNKQDC